MKLKKFFMVLVVLLLTCAGKKPVGTWKPPEPWWQVPDDVHSVIWYDKEGRRHYVIKREGDNITIETPSHLIDVLITTPYAGWYRTRSAVDPEINKKESLIIWFGEDEMRDIDEILKEKVYQGCADKRGLIGSGYWESIYFYWKIEDKYMWMSKDGKVWYRALIGASNKDDEYFYLRCDPLGIEGYFAPSESPEEEFRKQKASK